MMEPTKNFLRYLVCGFGYGAVAKYVFHGSLMDPNAYIPGAIGVGVVVGTEAVQQKETSGLELVVNDLCKLGGYMLGYGIAYLITK